MEREFRKVNVDVSKRICELRHEIEREFPLLARVTALTLGPVLLWTTRREAKRLAAGQTYEPPVFIERRNWSPSAKSSRSDVEECSLEASLAES